MVRLWNVTVTFVDKTKELSEHVVLSSTPGEALQAALGEITRNLAAIDTMTIRENGTSIDVVAWEPSR